MDAQTPKPATGHPNLIAALAAAQMQMGKAFKSVTNPHFKTKYAGLAEVMDACMGALNAHGIAVMQPITERDGKLFVTTILAHEAGGSVECAMPMIIQRNDMQGLGSAITYARRYGLMCMAGIAPYDDDGNAAAAAAPRQEPARQPARAQADDAPAIRAAIAAAQTVDALMAIWRDLPEDQREAMRPDLALRKAAILAAEEAARTAPMPPLEDEIPY